MILNLLRGRFLLRGRNQSPLVSALKKAPLTAHISSRLAAPAAVASVSARKTPHPFSGGLS